jgi:2-methylcitrate dehydratase
MEGMMDGTTARLVDCALGAEYAKLPAEAVHECKRRLIDTLACIVAAYDEPLCAQARAVAQRYSANGGASVIGCRWQAMPEAATFANGVMMRYFDMMDTYLGKTRGHPSDAIMSILAVGEALHADGRAVIGAIVLAYDVFCTFCDAIDINSRGWDQPVIGGIAGVLGIGRLMGLSRDQMASAISLALAPNMALFRTRRGELSHWKGCAAANGARNAVFAAYLARDGINGPTEVFEGKYGLWDAVGKFDWPLRSGDAPYLVTQTHLKAFPIVYHAQPTAWAGLDLRAKVKLDEIADLRIDTYRTAVDMNGTDPSRWAPQTRETADHSLPYVLAAVLKDGEITEHSFAGDKLTDPALRALMQKIKVFEDPALTAQYPQSAPCRVTARLASGREIVCEVVNPKGHVSNPFSDREIEDKFRTSFKTYGSDAECERALLGLRDIDRANNIGDVMKLFVVGGRN